MLLVARSERSRARAARVAAEILQPNNPTVRLGAGPRIGDAGTGVDFTASLVQQLQIAGERRLRIDAAQRLRDLTDAEIEMLRWAVHADVHAAFHRVLIEERRAELNALVLEFQEDVLAVVEKQIAAGEVSPLALRMARAEVAQARQALIGAEQVLYASRIRLAQLSGWPPSRPPAPRGEIDELRPPPPLESLVQLALERQPSLEVRRAAIEESRARVDLEDRRVWPQPSLGVQYQHEGNPGPDGAFDIILGTVAVPIPGFQRNQGGRAAARADVLVSRAELTAQQRLLEGDVANAHSAVAAALARTEIYQREILPRFEDNLRLLRRSFELGEIEILALAAGRERLLRIQSDALAAQLDYFVAVAGLERVVGVELWRDRARADDGGTATGGQ